MLNKTAAITTVFANINTFMGGVGSQASRRQVNDYCTDWILTDQHYPIARKQVEEFLIMFCNEDEGMCSRHLIDSKGDFGASTGFNKAFAFIKKYEIKSQPIEYILGIDPDVILPEPNTIEKMISIMDSDQELAFLSLTPRGLPDRSNLGETKSYDGIPYLKIFKVHWPSF